MSVSQLFIALAVFAGSNIIYQLLSSERDFQKALDRFVAQLSAALVIYIITNT